MTLAPRRKQRKLSRAVLIQAVLAAKSENQEPPELFGLPTANLALGVSLFAALLAAASLLVAVLTYRRNGARIKVELDEGQAVINDITGQRLGPVFLVTVANTGHADVDVRNVSWRRKRRCRPRWESDALLVGPSDGATWPRTVRGLSEESFPLYRQVLDTNLALASSDVWVRADVVLAGGRKYKSNRLKLRQVGAAALK